MLPRLCGFLACLSVLALLAGLAVPVHAQADDEEDEALPTIAEKTEDFEKMDGFFPIYWDDGAGKVWLEIPRFDEDFLYVSSLPAGLGSNDVGLDRGQLGSERVVRFERVGPKVLLVEPNLRYRATSDNASEQQAVRDAFAAAVVWGFEAAAESDGRVLVDATDFVVRDAHGIARRLKETDQGTYALDASRSVLYRPHLKAFPQNTELEARLTFTTDEEPGGYVQDVAADPFALTMRVRHSFVQLPDTSGYAPRRHDPRSGFNYTVYRDYAVPIGEPIPQRWINRHRLACAGSRDADGLCAPEEPIVYYLDPGTPEPVRSALLEGARWWAQAFEAAGFRDAYRVEMLPDDADPMDARYNVIQWVHRRTRGWSYGSSVTDPRTGEILKGHVTLGSLRVRQDYLLAEGLLAPYQGDHARGVPPESDPMLQMALARIRQLSAHEVGHTLGLAHNFAASVNSRASVMDYPAPLATVQGDSVSLADAYDTGIGAWDEAAIRYGYAQPSAGQSEADLLDAAVQAYQDAGLRYITDDDARPAGAAHPKSNLWDNGDDMVASLDREMAVRRVALERFGEATIRSGEPMALLEEVLVPLYLRHRYQVDATAKLVGGVIYDYAVRGDGDMTLPARVDAEQQMGALDGLLDAVAPPALRLPDAARTQLPPRPPGHPPNRELFPGRTHPTFDAYAPAEVASAMVLDAIVQPERAMRLVAQHDADPSLPSLRDVLARTTDAVWKSGLASDPHEAELQRTVQQVWTDVLLERAGHADAPAVRARATQHLRGLSDWLGQNAGPDPETQAHRTEARSAIDRFLQRTQETTVPASELALPPGSPIGQAPAYHLRQTRRRAWLERWAPPALACGR